MKGKTFSITLPTPTTDKLDEYSRLMGTSRSGGARFIITQFFNNNPQENKDVVITSDVQTEKL